MCGELWKSLTRSHFSAVNALKATSMHYADIELILIAVFHKLERSIKSFNTNGTNW